MTDVERQELALYESHAPLAGSGRFVRRDGWVQLTSPEAPTVFRNEVLLSVVAPDGLEARIDATIAHYGELPFRWFVTPATRPADTGPALLAKGFVEFETVEALQARPADFGPPTPGVVEEIGEDGIERWLEADQRAWGLPPAAIERFRRELQAEFARRPRRKFYFQALAESEPAACGSVFLLDGFAHFSGSATVPEFRRRGLYRELILTRMAFLRARGVDLVTNHCVSTTSAPICRRLGFEKACEFKTYRYPP